MKTDFFNLTLGELGDALAALGYSPRHGASLYGAIYKGRGLEDLANYPAVPVGFVDRLSDALSFNELTAESIHVSRYDRSVKFLVALPDNNAVEAVLIPEDGRLTLCLSSQIGCAQACSFCYTGRMGLKRNLTAGEIVGQVLLASRWVQHHPDWVKNLGFSIPLRITNLVFMGMGEPLDNVDAVSTAIAILTEQLGLAIGLRKISVSTAGHLDGLKVLLQRYPNVSLALSLHATTDRERSQLMPINRRWPMREVLDYLRHHHAAHAVNRTILIQYTMIRGVNDSLDQAERLADLLRELPVKVNIIPFNDVAPSRFRNPEPGQLHEFRNYLHQRGLRVMVRYSKGQDIGAACGQLVVERQDQRLSENAINV